MSRCLVIHLDKFPSPIAKGDNPELDTSELLDSKGIEMYHSMIGALQWVVTIGRLDITIAVMTMLVSEWHQDLDNLID
jgi:hypothetical protein